MAAKRSSRKDCQSLTWRDYYQMVTTLAMLFLGPAIWVRALAHPSPMAWVVGAGFLGLGIYRALAFIRYFTRRHKEVHA
ncbi:MAG: hypothetical protein PWP70_1958 [Moorella sp. (in: firmicutes)]|nr:hypothetical protein [Moorella sp. (in: firmicutes)]